MYDIRKIFATNIKRLRKERNLTQEKFAELVGVQWKSIVNFENGRNIPNTKNLQSICDNLKIHPEELFQDNSIKKDDNFQKINKIINLIKNMETNILDITYKIVLAIAKS